MVPLFGVHSHELERNVSAPTCCSHAFSDAHRGNRISAHERGKMEALVVLGRHLAQCGQRTARHLRAQFTVRQAWCDELRCVIALDRAVQLGRMNLEMLERKGGVEHFEQRKDKEMCRSEALR